MGEIKWVEPKVTPQQAYGLISPHLLVYGLPVVVAVAWPLSFFNNKELGCSIFTQSIISKLNLKNK